MTWLVPPQEAWLSSLKCGACLAGDMLGRQLQDGHLVKTLLNESIYYLLGGAAVREAIDDAVKEGALLIHILHKGHDPMYHRRAEESHELCVVDLGETGDKVRDLRVSAYIVHLLAIDTAVEVKATISKQDMVEGCCAGTALFVNGSQHAILGIPDDVKRLFLCKGPVLQTHYSSHNNPFLKSELLQRINCCNLTLYSKTETR